MIKKIAGLFIACAFLLGSVSFVSNNANAAPIINYSIPTPDASYTVVNAEYKTFDNSYFYSAIFSAISFIVTKKMPALEAKSAGTAAATGVITQWIQNKLGASNTYVQVRQGISFNSYYNYYTYVESVIWYTNDSYITPIDVYYADTLTRVPDDVLKLYNLKNP